MGNNVETDIGRLEGILCVIGAIIAVALTLVMLIGVVYYTQEWSANACYMCESDHERPDG